MVSLALDSTYLAETYDRVGERQLNHGKELIAADVPHDFEVLLRQVFASSDLAESEDVSSGTTHKVSSAALREQLRTAGFYDIQLEIKSFVDHFDDTEAVIGFNTASSFGNFLANLTDEQRAITHSLLEGELEKRREPAGIRLQRNLSFAIASRPL